MNERQSKNEGKYLKIITNASIICRTNLFKSHIQVIEKKIDKGFE